MNLHGFQLNLRSYKYLVITQSLSNEHASMLLLTIVYLKRRFSQRRQLLRDSEKLCLGGSFSDIFRKWKFCFVSIPVTTAVLFCQLCCSFLSVHANSSVICQLTLE